MGHILTNGIQASSIRVFICSGKDCKNHWRSDGFEKQDPDASSYTLDIYIEANPTIQI